MSGEYRDHFDAIERKWQGRWEAERAFEAPRRPGAARFYCLEMLPYPSGRLHMGHVRNYSIGDAVARFNRMRGFQVLHPMGWDSFGLPAENAAIKHGIHPARWTNENIAAMAAQLRRLGLSYDWEREIAAHRPEYYRWNQWFFLKMLERDLAYRSRRWVNWCSSCRTVLANEQVEAGRCWRCDSPVGRTELDQWFLKITAYAGELDGELDRMTGWPERVRLMQRNWIGRSDGAIVRFPILDAAGGPTDGLEIFTTRLDTIHGATFCVVAPRHPILARVPDGSPARREIEGFIRRLDARDVTRAGMQAEEKEGIDTGLRQQGGSSPTTRPQPPRSRLPNGHEAPQCGRIPRPAARPEESTAGPLFPAVGAPRRGLRDFHGIEVMSTPGGQEMQAKSIMPVGQRRRKLMRPVDATAVDHHNDLFPGVAKAGHPAVVDDDRARPQAPRF